MHAALRGFVVRLIALLLLALMLGCSPSATGSSLTLAPTPSPTITPEATPVPPNSVLELYADYQLVYNPQTNLWEVQNNEGMAVAQQTQEAGDWQIHYEQLAQDERINIFDANTFPETYKDIANNWLEYTKNHTNAEIDAQWEDYQQFVEAARNEFFEREGIADEVAAIKDINPELQSLWGMIYWAQNNRQDVISDQMMPVITPTELRSIIEDDSGSIVGEGHVGYTWTEEKVLPNGIRTFSAYYGHNSTGVPSRWYDSNAVGRILGRDNIQTKSDPGTPVWGDLSLITQISLNETGSTLILSHLKVSPDSQEAIRHRLAIRFVSFEESFTLPKGSICGGWDNEKNHHYAMETTTDVHLGPLVTASKGNSVTLENIFNNLGANVNFAPPFRPLGGVYAHGCIDTNLGLEIAGTFENIGGDINNPSIISDQAWPWQSQANSVERQR